MTRNRSWDSDERGIHCMPWLRQRSCKAKSTVCSSRCSRARKSSRRSGKRCTSPRHPRRKKSLRASSRPRSRSCNSGCPYAGLRILCCTATLASTIDRSYPCIVIRRSLWHLYTPVTTMCVLVDAYYLMTCYMGIKKLGHWTWKHTSKHRLRCTSRWISPRTLK